MFRSGSRILMALSVVAAAVLTGCSGGSNVVDDSAAGQFRFVGATPAGRVIPAVQRKEAGALTAPYLNGTTFALQSLRGKVVVLNFWAPWCPPCVSEEPALERTYIANRAKGATVVGIAVKSEKGDVKSFVLNRHVTYPVVFDEIAKSALRLGVPTFGLPSTVVIDRQGRVAAVYLGAVLQSDLQPVVRALASAK